MYRGLHRHHRGSPGAARPFVLATALVLGLLGPSASGTAAPRECRGAPTAVGVTIQIPMRDEAAQFAVHVSKGDVFDPSLVIASATLTFSAGQTQASVNFSGVQRGTYTVAETDPGPFPPAPEAVVVVDPPTCAPQVTFAHS